DDGEKPHTPRAEPRAFFPRGPGDVRLRPAEWPTIFIAIEAGGAHPVLQRELVRVANAEPALLRRVHEEETTERPERLATERLLGLLVDDEYPAAGVRNLHGSDEPREPGTD